MAISTSFNGNIVIEIGKRDILTPQQVHRLRPDVTYYIVDLAVSSYEDPALIRKLFREVVTNAEEGTITALPLHVFPLSEASSAFRFMSQSKHIGKIIIRNDRSSRPATTIRTDATYLITGGLSGLGLLVAQWPAGNTVHRILVKGSSGDYTTVHEFSGNTEEGDWLIFTPDAPIEDVQFVQLVTSVSPSWVDWKEIQVFGELTQP